jgi:hypothetical protein
MAPQRTKFYTELRNKHPCAVKFFKKYDIRGEVFMFSNMYPNKNESESFVRLAPYFTFV